jgi:hypothetical protein
MTTQARKSSYTPEQWSAACVLHTGERESLVKADHAVPVRSPEGSPNPELMAAAVRALVNSDEDQARVRSAARELVRLYDAIDDNPPDSLKGLAGQVDRSHGYSGGGEDPQEDADPGATGAEDDDDPRSAELATLDAAYVGYFAQVAQPESGGALDPAKVCEFARERGISISAAYSALESALAGEYHGAAAHLMGRPATERARRMADREETSVGEAALSLSAGGESGPSDVLIADLADDYAERHGVDYGTALIAVQKGER